MSDHREDDDSALTEDARTPQDSAGEVPAAADTPSPGQGSEAPWRAGNAEDTDQARSGRPADADSQASPYAASPARRKGGSRWSLVLALAFAITAVVVAAYAGWQAFTARQALEDATADAVLRADAGRAEIEALEQTVLALRESLAAAEAERREAMSALERRLEPWPGRLADIERRIDAVAGGSLDTRENWMRAEAQYYLELANAELGLGGRWDTAIEALRIADARLAALTDPAYNNVRLQIAEELLALAAVERPDIDGMAFTLAGLARSAAQLPLRSGPASNYSDDPAALEDTPAGFGRFWQGVKDSLSGIVRVERRDAPVEPVLSVEEGRLARRQLLVELELARVALLGADEPTFSASLQTARQLLEADFERGDSRVRAAIETLSGLAGRRLTATAPDIGGSLTALRRLDDGGD